MIDQKRQHHQRRHHRRQVFIAMGINGLIRMEEARWHYKVVLHVYLTVQQRQVAAIDPLYRYRNSVVRM